jgi:septal ring factor EnvC (AmiA/AmiB activator)
MYVNVRIDYCTSIMTFSYAWNIIIIILVVIILNLNNFLQAQREDDFKEFRQQMNAKLSSLETELTLIKTKLAETELSINSARAKIVSLEQQV